jgi:hypothetical protein
MQVISNFNLFLALQIKKEEESCKRRGFRVFICGYFFNTCERYKDDNNRKNSENLISEN